MSTTSAVSTKPLDLTTWSVEQEAKAKAAAKVADGDPTKKGTLGKDDFLNLLVTQLRYQDPMNPTDNQQMAAQMAQFSSLEVMNNVKTSIDAMGTSIESMVSRQTDASNSMATGAATNLMGRTVNVKSVMGALPADGKGTDWNVAATPGSILQVIDSNGKAIRNIELNGVNPDGTAILSANGLGKVHWDGRKDTGEIAAAGNYRVEIKDANLAQTTGYLWNQVKVDGLTFDDEGVLLSSKGQNFRMSDLLAVSAENK
jgi:flagellar basal-body rod modification protein FlgD